MRILTTSDLHVDYPQNLKWVEELSALDYKDDLLIVGGDITHDMQLLLKVMEELKGKFAEVSFVVGNHDVWIKDEDYLNSFDKHNALVYYIQQLEIHTKPFQFNNHLIVLLASWYDYSFGSPTEKLKNQWMDFFRCNWNKSSTDEVFDFFAKQNEAVVNPENLPVITCSHFVPNMKMFPQKFPPIVKLIAPCLGSSKIDQWLRAHNSQVHIYGHSHLNRDIQYDGVRYVNNAYGYPREEKITRKELVEIIL